MRTNLRKARNHRVATAQPSERNCLLSAGDDNDVLMCNLSIQFFSFYVPHLTRHPISSSPSRLPSSFPTSPLPFLPHPDSPPSFLPAPARSLPSHTRLLPSSLPRLALAFLPPPQDLIFSQCKSLNDEHHN
ncbi:hypothetical protein Fmac_032334 [Flemingia macrophylla]|uniref:Uncharacterized protein n=1 Tax=Flemingia macrophylla TaxID=520843 RepID=A0ABD1L527_9FABA